MSLWSPYAIHLHCDGDSSALITGVSDQNIPVNPEVSRDQTAGSQYPAHVSVTAQKPRPRFMTYNLAVALDLVGLTGKAITSTTNAGLEFYKVLLGANGQPSSGSVHTKIAVRKGLIMPSRISCTHQQHAQIEYMIYPQYDGTNDILTTTASVALPAASWGDTERFGLYQWSVNSVTVDQITELEIDFGLQADTFGGDGDLWDTDVEVQTIAPELRITGRFVDLFASGSIPLAGKSAAHANTTGYFQKRLQTAAGYVAAGTAEHIAMTVAGLAVWDEVFQAQGQAHGMGTVRIPLIYDGTNAPITFDTSAAIS